MKFSTFNSSPAFGHQVAQTVIARIQGIAELFNTIVPKHMFDIDFHRLTRRFNDCHDATSSQC